MNATDRIPGFKDSKRFEEVRNILFPYRKIYSSNDSLSQKYDQIINYRVNRHEALRYNIELLIDSLYTKYFSSPLDRTLKAKDYIKDIQKIKSSFNAIIRKETRLNIEYKSSREYSKAYNLLLNFSGFKILSEYVRKEYYNNATDKIEQLYKQLLSNENSEDTNLKI